MIAHWNQLFHLLGNKLDLEVGYFSGALCSRWMLPVHRAGRRFEKPFNGFQDFRLDPQS